MFSHSTRKDVQELYERIDDLQAQINALSRLIGVAPQPPRASWQRHSAPAFGETEKTRVVPAVAGVSVLPRRIWRVELSTLNGLQWVNAYDIHGEKIPEFCGSFRHVGRKILEREPNLKWKVVGPVEVSA